jgi:hypothetical protein
MNNNGNNFSFIRNNEINRIGPHYISPIFYHKFNIHDEMKKLDAYEDEIYVNNHSQIWKRDESYEHKYCNKIVNVDYDKQYCIIGMDSLLLNIEKITLLNTNSKNDFILLDNKCSIEHLHYFLDIYGFSNFKCYTLIDETPEILIKYFLQLYKSCDNYEIINNYIYKLNYNTNLHQRHLVINQVSNSEDKYLEIGVETGFTFNNVHFLTKTGVDPSPTFNSDDLVLKTSDDFFGGLEASTTYDIIFIDGMHQTEYVLKDFNNSIKYLNENGKILLDDIIPLNVNEQLKVPFKHNYVDGILKTLIPWTGDVWKFLFHVLTFYGEHIDFQYYYNLNYRGVAVLKIKEKFTIPDSDIDTINSYDYTNDFLNYMNLITNREKLEVKIEN